MAYPYTDTGYNMFDMLSMIQKAIRRGDYEHAGFAAEQLKTTFRAAMWNRLFVISSEDCFGIITKELVELRKMDESKKSDQNISSAVSLLCRSKKSRDACYFACNFVLASRKPRTIEPTDQIVSNLSERLGDTKNRNSQTNSDYDSFGFQQISLFSDLNDRKEDFSINPKYEQIFYDGASLQMAIQHLDMDMIGYFMNLLRFGNRKLIWDVFEDYAKHFVNVPIENEIAALRRADGIVNGKRRDGDKDEIFISKAAMLLCYCSDVGFEDISSSDVVKLEGCIDWNVIKTKPIGECILKAGEIPEWVYDCHTLKGKKMGKTDWDMTRTEQEALFPLRPAYFDDASWLHTYEDDFQNGRISSYQMQPIREFAKTRQVNPVKFIPYDD